MDVPYDNYQQNYGYDARHYDAEVAGNGSYSNNGEPHAPGTGVDYGRERREVDYNRGPGGGRGNDYGYDGRGMGDRGGGNPAYQREGSREYDRFSDSYDDSASNSSRDRDRERDRDRSRRDRDRRDRHRPRDRDHERSRERRERRDRDRSPSGRYDDYGDGDDSYRDRDRDGRDAREDRGGEKWMTDTPTNTILLRGLPSQVDEKDIRAELMMFGAPVKDVRLMRRSTGASRGFAFVEFQNVTDAQRWMDQKQGLLNMLNQYSVTMHYSTPRVGPEKFVQHKTDWTCSKCGVHNFKRRDYCFKCNISRDESDKTKDGDGFDQVGTNPCNTLIFRGLDALTTEESLDAALRLQTNLQSKNVRIIRDPVTNTSRGYGFCEMNSIQESTQVLDYLSLNNVPLEVDGKQVLVAYAKNTFSTVMATLNSTSQQGWDYATQQAAVQQGSDFYSQQQYYMASGTTTAAGEYDPATGQYYNQATGQYYDGQSYDYSQYYAQQGAGLQTDTTNAAAAVAQAAIAQANAAKNYNRQNSGPKKSEASTEQATTTTVDGKDYPVYPPPDVSTYQFDKSSGYYYDSTTGLYYDANSQFDCPVEDCDVSLIWHKLRNHWLNVHEPTITSYTCPLPTCQFKRDKKTSGKYNHKVNFLCHLNKVHGKVGSQCDLIIKMAKVETNKNADYFDPGFLLCPQPKQVPEPPKLLEMDVVKDTAVEDTLKTAPEPRGKPIASFTKTNVSGTQKKKLTIAEQRSSLVVIKTTSSKPQVPSTPKWIFGTSKKRRKKKNATETSEPQKSIEVQKPPETPRESQPETKKKMPQPQQEKMTKSEKIQQKKKVAAKMRAELIAQETAAPVPELYDPTPAKEKEKLARPLLKLKLKISTPIIKQQQIVKTKCPVEDCSDDFEAKYSEKLKHYYLVHVQNHFQCPECQSNFGYPDFNVHMKTEHDYSDEKLGDLENVAVTNENFIDPGSHVSYFFEPEAAETPTEDNSRKEDTVTTEISPISVSGKEPPATAVETESLFVEGDSSKEGVVGSRSHGNTLGLKMTASEKDVAEKSDQRKLPTNLVAEDSPGEMTRKGQNVDVSSDSSSKDEGERSSAVQERIIKSSEKAAGKDSAMTSTSVSKEPLKPDGKATNLTKGKAGNTQANPFHEKYSYYPFKCPVPRCYIILKSGSDRVDHYEKFHHRFCYSCKFCGQLLQRNLFRSHLKKDHMMNFNSINVCLQNCQTKNPLYIDPKKHHEFFRTGVIAGIRPQILPEAVKTFCFEDNIKNVTASTSSDARSHLEKTDLVMKKDSDAATHSVTQTGEKSLPGDGSLTTKTALEVDNPSKKAASVSMPSLASTTVNSSSDATSVEKDALQNEPGKCIDEKDAIYPIKCPVPRCSVNLCSKQLRVNHYEISHYKFLFKCHLCTETLQRRLFRTHLKSEHKLNVSKEAARIVRIPNPHYVDPGPFEEFLDRGFLKHAEMQKYLASCKSTESNKSSSTSDVQGKSCPEKTELVMKKDISTRSETQPEEKHLLRDENTIKESATQVCAPTAGKGAVGINMPSLLLTQTSVSSELSEKSSQNEPEEQSPHLKDDIYPMKCPVPRCFINLRSDKQRLDHFEISHYKFLFQCHLCHKTCQRRLFRSHLQDDHNLDLSKEAVKKTEVPNPHYVDPGLFKDFLAKEVLDNEDKQNYLASCGSAESNISKIYPMKCPVPRCLIHLQSDKQRVDHFEISHFRYLFQCHFCHKNFQRKLYRPHLKNAHNLHADSVIENDHQIPNPHYVDPGLFQEFLEKGILKDIDKQKYLASFCSAESDTSSTSGIQGKFDPEKTESFEKEADISTCSDLQTDETSLGSESSAQESAKEGSTSSSGEKAATLDEKDNIYPMKCPVPRCSIKLRSDKQRVDHYEISHYKFLFLCHLCHRSFQRKLIRPHLQDDHNLDVSREAVKEVRIPNPHYVDPGLFEDFLEQGVLKDVDKQKYLASCGAAGSKTTSRSGVQGKSDPETTDSSEKKEVDSSICSDTQAGIKIVPEKESSIEKSTTKFVLSSMEENTESQYLDEKDKSVTEESQGQKNQNSKPDSNDGISSDVKIKNATEDSLLENSAIEDVEKAGKTTTIELDPLCSDKKLESETEPEEDYPGETLSPEGRAGTEHTTEKDKSTKADDQASAGRDLSTEGTSSEVPVPASDEVKQIAELDTSAGETPVADTTLTTISTAADAPQSLQSSLSTSEKKNAEEPLVKASKPAVSEKGATIPRRVTRSVSSIPSTCKDSSRAQVESKKDATTGSEDAKNSNTSLSKDCLKSITTVHSVRPNLLTIQTVNDYTPAAKLSFSPASVMIGKKAKSPALTGHDILIKNVSSSSSDKIDKRTPHKVTKECSTKETTSEKVMTKNDKNEKIVIGEDDSVTKDHGATAPHTKPVTETVSDNKTMTTTEEKNIGITDKESVKSCVTEKNTNDDGKSMKVVSPISIATVHSVRPNLVAIKTVEDFRTPASSSVPSATIMTKKREESPALTHEQSSVKVPAKTKEKNVPPVVEKMHFSEKNKIYPLKCPVPKCQFNIKSGTERVDHFEKIHYKYYFGCNICGGIFQKKLFRPHQRNDHFMARTGTLDEAKIPNPFYVDPGTFLQFFKTGILEGFNYKSNQGNLAIDSMSKVETKSKSQKTVTLTKKTSEDDKKTDELKKSTKESKGKSPHSTETKVESKRKPESSRSKTKSTEGIHESTRSRHESTRRQSKLTESRQSSRNKPEPKAKDSKQESIESKPGSAESKQKSTGSKQESSGSKAESTETKPESAKSKPESTGSKPESIGSKQESSESKPKSTGSKPDLTESKPESTESKSGSTGSKQELSGSKPESTESKSGSTGSKQELSGSKPESTGSKSGSTGSKQELSGSKPESTGSKSGSTGSKQELSGSKPDSTGSKSGSTGSKQELSGSKPESTGSKSGSTGSKQELSGSKPESTGSKSGSTGSKQELSGSKPESTGSKSGSTGSKPESTGSKSGSTGSKQELSGSKPESTGSKSGSTGSKPESTGSKSGSTGSKQELSGGKPESTESKPESPRSKPESTGSKPKSSGSKPDPDSSESKATGSKLKNTPDSKKSQHEHQTKADDTKKGDDKSRRAGHASNLRKSDLRRHLSENRKRRVEKESDDKSKRLRRNDHPREERKGTERRTASRGSRHERSRGDRDKPVSLDERKRKIDVKSNEDSKRLRKDDSREERKGSKNDIKQKPESVKSRHASESRKTDSKGGRREPNRDGKPLKRHDSKEEKSQERSSRRSSTDKSKKLPYIKPKVIYASEPCSKLPKVGDTDDELMWFLSWTDEYIVKLEEAQRDAERQLKDIKP